MDVAADEVVPEVMHGVGQYVPGDGLDDVFHKFWAVGFDAVPFSFGIKAHVGDGCFPVGASFQGGAGIGKAAA